MNKKSFLLSLVLVFALSLSAFGAVKEFARFSIDVPEGWTAVEDGTTVSFTADDKSAALTVTVDDNDGTAIKDIAAAFSQKLNGSEPEVDEDDVYTFSFKNANDVDCHGVVCGDEKTFIMLAIIGEHDQLEGMIDSIENK